MVFRIFLTDFLLTSSFRTHTVLACKALVEQVLIFKPFQQLISIYFWDLTCHFISSSHINLLPKFLHVKFELCLLSSLFARFINNSLHATAFFTVFIYIFILFWCPWDLLASKRLWFLRVAGILVFVKRASSQNHDFLIGRLILILTLSFHRTLNLLEFCFLDLFQRVSIDVLKAKELITGKFPLVTYSWGILLET